MVRMSQLDNHTVKAALQILCSRMTSHQTADEVYALLQLEY